MGVTPVYAFPYPNTYDSSNGVAQEGALALGVETSLAALAGVVTTNAATILNNRGVAVSTLTSAIAAVQTDVNQNEADGDGVDSSQAARATAKEADTGWVTAGFLDFSSPAWEPVIRKARKIGPLVEVCIAMWPYDVFIDASSQGSITDIALTTVPAAYRPSNMLCAEFHGDFTAGCITLAANGDIIIRDMHPGSSLFPGDELRANFSFLAG